MARFWLLTAICLCGSASATGQDSDQKADGQPNQNSDAVEAPEKVEPSEYRIVEIRDYASVFASAVDSDSGASNPIDSRFGGTPSEPSLVSDLRSSHALEFRQWEYLVDELSSTSFAARERANEQLYRTGHLIVPLLKWRMTMDRDSEVQLRLSELLRALQKEHMVAMTTDFLAGDDTALDGWTVARQLMGDSSASRAAYVEIFRQAPDLARSLDGTTADREAAVSEFLDGPNFGMDRRGLTAVLLATADPMAQASLRDESQLGRFYLSSVSSDLRRMPDSMIYGERLLGAFLLKTSKQGRYEWLYRGLNLDLRATADLAKRTLTEANDVNAMAQAMAALVRYAEPSNVETLAAFFDDDRLLPMGGIGLQQGERSETRISDVAMAAAGALLGQSTDDIGFSLNANHPRFGLDISKLQIPVQDPEIAAAVRKQIRTTVEDLMKERALPRERPASSESPPN